MARLFFALWPDPDTRQQALALQRRLGSTFPGRPVNAANLHVTVLFLGTVTRSRIPFWCECLARLECDAFKLMFERVVYWRKGRVVVWTAGAPARLLEIRARLLAEAEPGLAAPEENFQPHMTLFRGVRRTPDELPELGWSMRASSLALLRSDPGPKGVCYRPILERPLA